MEGVLDASAFSSRSPPLGRDGLSCKIDRQKSSVIDLTSPGCSDHRVPRPQNVRERKCDPNPGQPGPRGRNLCRFDHRRVLRVPDGPPGPINLLISHAEHAGGKQSGGFRPRPAPMALLPGQHLEPADRLERPVRLGRHPPCDLYGPGETGSHGGSGLSALGGTVRLGELVPGGTIRHSLKLNIDSANFYPGLGGYRWPAWKSDAGGAGYGGSIPEVRMGSLLAPKPDFPIDTLETEPGKIVAAAFRDYGGYIVDTSGGSSCNFVTERSPAGSVQDEFNKAWGYSFNAGVGANGWARDLDKIFTNLYVVDNWDKATWQTVP